jgi:ligand-binding sensor domain-containing protein
LSLSSKFKKISSVENSFGVSNNGIPISKDGGRSFKNKVLGTALNFCNAIFVSKGVIYAATKNGLFTSRDDGELFEEFQSPYTNQNQINHIIKSDNKIYFSTDNGLFYFFLNSKIIIPLDSSIFNGEKIKKLHSQNGFIYAITASGKLFSSKDGVSYSPFFASILQDKKFLSVFFSFNEIYIGTKQRLAVSRDGGISFKFITHEEEGRGGNEINGIYKVGSILYVATNRGISISTDGGESFSIKNSNHGLGSNQVHDIFAQLANTPGFSLGVYAATDNGLAISEM